ncbi:cytochrome P450 704B1 [Pyrus ussuriensis x Pyrus communis]|uniref:Cytochrome P450 704B1 n=1 Tax=Pyrus ussuriensis x Pyrus communis TaxID=2448454 RepID=A0A5N5HGF9_9ROSA|nr:cytochrome P450 704B1 [Pyrus ussuriensis x Pyrus communis]
MELEAIISEDHSAEIPQILRCKLKARSLSLFPPKLSVRIEDPISEQDLHDMFDICRICNVSVSCEWHWDDDGV